MVLVGRVSLPGGYRWVLGPALSTRWPWPSSGPLAWHPPTLRLGDPFPASPLLSCEEYPAIPPLLGLPGRLSLWPPDPPGGKARQTQALAMPQEAATHPDKAPPAHPRETCSAFAPPDSALTAASPLSFRGALGVVGSEAPNSGTGGKLGGTGPPGTEAGGSETPQVQSACPRLGRA